MQLLPTQLDELSLSRRGQEAVSLLQKRDFHTLADRFGYAVAFGKNLATAIEDDIHYSLAEFQAAPDRHPSVPPSIEVKYFKPNDANLFALVECYFLTPEGCALLAELIVTTSGD